MGHGLSGVVVEDEADSDKEGDDVALLDGGGRDLQMGGDDESESWASMKGIEEENWREDNDDLESNESDSDFDSDSDSDLDDLQNDSPVDSDTDYERLDYDEDDQYAEF